MVNQAWTNCVPDRHWARKTSEGRTFCLVKKKKPVELQSFSQTDKTIEKLVNSEHIHPLIGKYLLICLY